MEGEDKGEELQEDVTEPENSTHSVAVPYPHYRLVRPSYWVSGILGYGGAWSTCCVTCFCPCVTFGRIAHVADRGVSSRWLYGTLYCVLSFFCVQCLYSFLYRKKLRAMYSLPELPCNDCCVHCCCERCALCQEEREIQYRAGWGEPAMCPPPVQQMDPKSNWGPNRPAKRFRMKTFFTEWKICWPR
ncbi:hypothetical protein SUGI_0448260 [Cryptomeria japonica]|uniref:cell number regulator 10 n=1 Tax=Cryptomeria japonica TaxID=3369 RepID=UPI002408D950|nr:cell number regulator 10 [Cryptomeria japonica]GLJ23669.1 hypothetical protein SUGI_0448260 [Cryptomeria japonica]